MGRREFEEREEVREALVIQRGGCGCQIKQRVWLFALTGRGTTPTVQRRRRTLPFWRVQSGPAAVETTDNELSPRGRLKRIALERLVGGATGEGIDENIRSGYMFLAQNYVEGDSIFIFGFSSGAFSARSLVGFVANCGLLKRQYLGHISEAWDYYRTENTRSPDDFCAKHNVDSQRNIQIDFLGSGYGRFPRHSRDITERIDCGEFPVPRYELDPRSLRWLGKP